MVQIATYCFLRGGQNEFDCYGFILFKRLVFMDYLVFFSEDFRRIFRFYCRIRIEPVCFLQNMDKGSGECLKGVA